MRFFFGGGVLNTRIIMIHLADFFSFLFICFLFTARHRLQFPPCMFLSRLTLLLVSKWNMSYSSFNFFFPSVKNCYTGEKVTKKAPLPEHSMHLNFSIILKEKYEFLEIQMTQLLVTQASLSPIYISNTSRRYTGADDVTVSVKSNYP